MTTKTQDESGEDLVEEAFEEPTEVVLEAPAEKSFQPWHKPRKHFIRLRQWCDEVRHLIADLAKARGGSAPERICYLTLPGDELLDVRVLHDTCRAQGVKLRYLGFNTPKGRMRLLESNLSQAEVQKLEHIDGPGSRVLHDRLEQIAVDRSVAGGALRRDAPFDVINLDFCDSVVDDPPKTKGSTLDAIKCLLDVQRTQRAQPWLLFVTTRVDKDTIDANVWEILLQIVSGNITSSEAFAAAIRNVALDKDPGKWINDGTTLHRAFIIGFGKWLLGLSTTARPHWKVQLISSYGYAVHAPMDILSLSFRFELVVEHAADGAGLVESATPRAPEEPELAALLAAEAARCMDIDRELANDAQLLEDMIRQSADLLASVRYSAEAYRQWLAGAPPLDGL